MDLNVSPDLDALYCYGIVLVLGAATAIRQISTRLVGIGGIWLVPRTWLLFAAYIGVPIGLFWLLDRTGAMVDTSLFAAILVGVGYERIITGRNDTLRAPGEVSQFWTPFIAYGDRVARSVREKIARSQRRLDERVIAGIVEDATRFKALESLATSRSPDIAALQSQLDAIDKTAASRGVADVLEQKTRLLYGVLATVPDGYYLMKSKGVIGRRLYWFNVQRGRSFIQSALAAAVVVALVAVGVRYVHPDYNGLLTDYYVWRAGKTNSSSIDQFRSRRHLLELMKDPARERSATSQLTTLLRRPALPMERVDLLLQILLESRGHPGGNGGLPQLLVQSLRTPSVDARTRINDVLKFLAERCPTKVDKDGSSWRPNEGDSTAVLEERLKTWEDYWATSCPSTGR
jgi:hypothetical protein